MRQCRARAADPRLVSTPPGTRETVPACRTATHDSTCSTEPCRWLARASFTNLFRPSRGCTKRDRVDERKILHPRAGLDCIAQSPLHGPRPMASKTAERRAMPSAVPRGGSTASITRRLRPTEPKLRNPSFRLAYVHSPLSLVTSTCRFANPLAVAAPPPCAASATAVGVTNPTESSRTRLSTKSRLVG